MPKPEFRRKGASLKVGDIVSPDPSWHNCVIRGETYGVEGTQRGFPNDERQPPSPAQCDSTPPHTAACRVQSPPVSRREARLGVGKGGRGGEEPEPLRTETENVGAAHEWGLRAGRTLLRPARFAVEAAKYS